MKEVDKNIVVGILQASAIVEEQLNEALKPENISVPQFNVLRILRGQKQPKVSLNVVQQHMIKKMSNTSRLIDKLMEKGLVSREVCPENRRMVDIGITAKGLQLLQRIDAIISATEKHLTQVLRPKEKTELHQLLSQFNGFKEEKK